MRSIWLLAVTVCLLRGSYAHAKFDPSHYQDTPDGLKQLLADSIEAARAHENDKLDRIVDSMRIPGYAQWFADSEYHSESWVEAYSKQLASPWFGVSLKCRLHEFSDRDGAVATVRINDGPNAPHSFEDGWIHNLKKPVNIYHAEWKDRAAEEGTRPDFIGYFVYVDGAFRWYSIIREASFNLPHGWAPRRTVTPKYPYPLDGQHASGVVHLKFVIRDDGFIDKVQPITAYDSTKDQALIKSAIEAVSQWNLMRIPRTDSAAPNVSDFRIRVAPDEAH